MLDEKQLPTTAAVRERLTQALKSSRREPDYLEIRLEESRSRRIVYRGKELEDIGGSFSIGGCARAINKGGWGFASFNDIELLLPMVEQVIQQAKLVGKEITQLAQRQPVEDIVAAPLRRDPSLYTMAQIKALLDEYNEVIWSTPKIQTSVISYGDTQKTVYFANSEGSFIQQSRHDVGLRVSAVARDGAEVQQLGLSLGSNGDF